MFKNRSNRPRKDMPVSQGRKDWETGETHAPLNNHQPRVGIAKWKRRHKCDCEVCSGRKSTVIGELEKNPTKWNFD